jgi:hypothetical protein
MLTIALLFIAQTAGSMPVDLQPDESFVAVLKILGGLKGAGAMTVALACVQAVMLFFRTEKFSSWSGKWRLTVVSFLSIVAGVLASRVSGGDWLSSLVNGGVLASMSVFGNQVFQQFKGDGSGKLS